MYVHTSLSYQINVYGAHLIWGIRTLFQGTHFSNRQDDITVDVSERAQTPFADPYHSTPAFRALRVHMPHFFSRATIGVNLFSAKMISN